VHAQGLHAACGAPTSTDEAEFLRCVDLTSVIPIPAIRSTIVSNCHRCGPVAVFRTLLWARRATWCHVESVHPTQCRPTIPSRPETSSSPHCRTALSPQSFSKSRIDTPKRPLLPCSNNRGANHRSTVVSSMRRSLLPLLYTTSLILCMLFTSLLIAKYLITGQISLSVQL